MDFRTIVNIPDPIIQIDHYKSILMIGSCFSQNISLKLQRQLFHTLSNPLGILYNAASISNCLNRIANKVWFTEGDIIFNQGQYHTYYNHSSLSTSEPQKLLENLNNIIIESNNILSNCKVAFITLGTSWVYELKSNRCIVGNCHKMPSELFNRCLLTVDETASYLQDCINNLKTLSPEIKIIFTVSPIRHLSDGAHQNQISKSILHIAIDKIIRNNPTVASYFPSYEIVCDELRDYRFYSYDMCHVSDVAINYIYERFSDTFFNDTTKLIANESEKLTRRLDHKVTSESTNALAFINDTQIKASQLIKKYPFLKNAYELYIKQYK